MKKIAGITLTALAIMASACHSDKTQNEGDGAYTPTTSDSLRVALANQDSLLMLMNDVSEGLSQIKQMENLLDATTGMGPEAQNKRQQIRNDIMAIQQQLQKNRDRVADLEKRLAASNSNNQTLQRSIETLKKSIAEQEGTISRCATNWLPPTSRLTRSTLRSTRSIPPLPQCRKNARRHRPALSSSMPNSTHATM